MLKAVAPKLTSVQAKEVIQRTATDAGTIGRDDYYGYGYIHAKAALLSVLSLTEEEALAANAVLGQARRLVPVEDGMGISVALPKSDGIRAALFWECYDANGWLIDRQLFMQAEEAASKIFKASSHAKTVKIYIWTDDLHPLCDIRTFPIEVNQNENS